MLPEDANYAAKYRSTLSTSSDPSELKTDLKLLLECLKYHESEPDVLKDGLLTVASICLESARAQDDFRELGGLNFVLNLLTTTDHESVLESAMYMLGCATERNVFSQKRLCNKAVFRFLECNLVNQRATTKLKQTVSYLLLCLVTNNSAAQALINTSHCLHALLDIFRSQFPGYKPSPDSPSQFWSEKSTNPDGSSLQLWKTVTSTLTGCVNNPQNDTNQLQCSTVFSVALDILRQTKDHQVIRLLASFLSLSAANSARNQDHLGMLGGMDVIVNALQTVVEALIQEPSANTTEAAEQLASLLVSCVTDNEWNKMCLAELRAVPLLVQLLSLEVIDTEVRLKVILTLGHLTEGCEMSQRQLVESDGLGLIVHTMTGQQDEEFTKAATYLLHTCVKVVKSTDETRLTSDVEICQTSSTAKSNNLNGKGLPLPKLKPQVKVRKVPSTSSEKDDLVSMTSTSVSSHGRDKECQEEVTEKTQEETNKEHDAKQVEGDKTKESNTSDTTVEALYKEICTRKELELKLQEEIQTRENLEVEKLELEKREEERMRVDNLTKKKAQAITQELHRQYLMATKNQGPDLIYSSAKQNDAKAASKSKEAGATEQSKQVVSQSPNKEVQILEKKVEQLEKQLQKHIIQNDEQQSVHNTSMFCASCGSAESVELSPQPVKSRPTLAISSPGAAGGILQDVGGDDAMNQLQRKKISRKRRSDEIHKSSSHKTKNGKRGNVIEIGDISMESSQSVDTTSTFRSSVQRSHSNVAKSLFQQIEQGEISTKSSQRAASSGSKTPTPNVRHSTRPQLRESVFRLPSSTVTKKKKSIKQDKLSQVDINSSKRSHEINKPMSSTPRPTYAEEVLPYKQQRYTSPLTLPKHIVSFTPNDNDESDLESILSDITDCYSVADSGVSWSDVKLNLPVRPSGKKSKVKKEARSKQCGERANSIKSSASTRSRQSYVVRYVKQHNQEKGRQSNILTSPNSSTSTLNCPGCDPPVHRPLLTSRNFLYTLEKSRHTCPEHRELQKTIKQHINCRKKLIEKRTSQNTTNHLVPCTPPRKTPETATKQQGSWTPHNSQYNNEYSLGEESTPKSESSIICTDRNTGQGRKARRKRQDFTQEEIDNLIAGVQKSGKHWNYILWSYRFKPGRTAVDLKDKYRRMQAQNIPGVLPKSPAHKQCRKRLFWNRWV